jgi:hypothetical protein
VQLLFVQELKYQKAKPPTYQPPAN